MTRGARLHPAMTSLRLSVRLAAAALACVAAAGCSMFHHDAKPAAPPPAAARSPDVAAQPTPSLASAAASAPGGGLVAMHLEAEAIVGHTWIFPSASPMLYGENRFVFKRDHVEASNAREHATGTWSLEGDKLCVTLNLSSSGSACYYVTGTPPGDLQIPVLPDGDRVPLKIQ